MKKYTTPELELKKVSAEDIMAVSMGDVDINVEELFNVAE